MVTLIKQPKSSDVRRFIELQYPSEASQFRFRAAGSPTEPTRSNKVNYQGT